MTCSGQGQAKWDFCMYRLSAIKLIFPEMLGNLSNRPAPPLQCYLNFRNVQRIRTALSCNLLLPYSASQWADGIATIIKTSPHAQARSSVYAVYVCLTRTVLLSPVCCSVFKEKHDGRTRKYLSEGDGVESHWVPWGLFTGHAHKYRTISPRWQVERRGSWWVKGCREKRGNIAIVNEP